MGINPHIKMKFYVETYGCTANQGNSEEFVAYLVEKGHVISKLEDADLVIVNTCVVTERTERNMIKRLHQLEGNRLIIAGCLPKAIPEAIENVSCHKVVGNLDRSLGVKIEEDMAPGGEEKKSVSENQHLSIPIKPDHLCAVVNISEGCEGNCSYCIVKKARGTLKSRSPEKVVKAVRSHLRAGAVEIQLASQDAAAYGMDIDCSLPYLLDRITDIPDQYKVRVGMMNPTHLKPILNDLIKSYQDPRIYNFIHLPIQSGSDVVLEKMNRKYEASDFVDMASKLREGIADITLFTDVIVGFPGETEADFMRTEDLIKTVRPEKVNVTRFSARPYTEAYHLKEMPTQVKKDRSRKLTKLWHDIAAQQNSKYQGQVISTLITERGKNATMKGRSDNYREIVVNGKHALGNIMQVKITVTNSFYLKGIVENQVD